MPFSIVSTASGTVTLAGGRQCFSSQVWNEIWLRRVCLPGLASFGTISLVENVTFPSWDSTLALSKTASIVSLGFGAGVQSPFIVKPSRPKKSNWVPCGPTSGCVFT